MYLVALVGIMDTVFKQPISTVLATSNDLIVIPNSVAAKAIITNHRRLNGARICTIAIRIDHAVAPTRVIETLQMAAGGSSGLAPGSTPRAYARRFEDALVEYELTFAIDEFTQTYDVRSDVIRRVADGLRQQRIAVGSGGLDVRIIQRDEEAVSERRSPEPSRETLPPA